MTLPTKLPFPLSGRSGAASETYALEGVQYHVAIGGMPFMLAPHGDRPLIRELADQRKEQFDNQDIPGEQSLAGWWLRSQSTFVGGAGLLYQDPDITNRWAIQYAESTGLSPWDNGRLHLLRACPQDISDSGGDQHLTLGFTEGGTDYYWSARGDILSASDGTTDTPVTWGGVEDIVSLASDGSRYFVADADGVWSGTGTGAGTSLYDLSGEDVVLGWAKGRLMAGIDNGLYELSDAGPTLPTAVFTHLTPDWRWTAIAEGPDCIYASGYAGSRSEVYKLQLTDVGDTPTLEGGGTQAAQLPHGERVLALHAYLGTYVGIGTTRGLRVAEIGAQGDLAYGPLVVETPVRAMVGYDRFLFCGAEDAIDGASGLYRVDLGQVTSDDGPVPSVRFAYATDLQTHASGVVDAVTLLGDSDRLVLTVQGSGSYLEAEDDLEPEGMCLTGRIRYNTLTDKIYKFLTVRSPVSNPGTVSVSVLDPTGGESTVLSVTGGSGRTIENVGLSSPITACEWLQLRIRFERDATDASTGPEVHGWQLKALPGEPRQKLLTLPLLAFDFEQDITGQTVGREGRTLARLEKLEAIAQFGDAVQYQDLRSGTSALVLIDRLEFRQADPPGASGSIYGGYLYIQLRTLTGAS